MPPSATIIACAVAHSPLVKTAFFASDPNLGRILAAVGCSARRSRSVSTIAMHLNVMSWFAERGGRSRKLS